MGAGPAGTTTAIKCVEAGLKVAVLESRIFPRDRPGETLHPGIEPLLETLGVAQQIREANFIRHDGIWVQWNNAGEFIPFGSDQKGPWLGFQAWRGTFDGILLERAKALGVEVIHPCRALRPLINGEKVIGVATSKGDYRSRFVVDAAGGQHWLGKKLGLKINFFSSRLIAYYGYVEGNCLIENQRPAIIADQLGWTWRAKIQPYLYQWTRLNFSEQRLASDWKPEAFQGMVTKYKTRSADVTWRLVSPCAGRGYFLVGDAAGVLDPASSHGVLKAIMSGIMAGHLIVQLVNQDAELLIETYSQWLTNWFEHDLTELNKMYRNHPHPPQFITL
ncbi:NAD(P)/FAD-dependent oxidoreductase [Crocosphaera watsonii]|uniref:NAD(P)/FAD-dependent oxidoreductase n=1 Tax=Crocosphaera watsonii TaxID=263511 RepID=UPI0002DE7E99|nr:NAD(P)/FAD-dependent oxidoreductase [Crocosphaera watsonii]